MNQSTIQPQKKSVAIITARGGSKRIPHKNIRDFCGKPIISYSIEAALSSGVFDAVSYTHLDVYKRQEKT